eukprot:gene5114-153_t
MSEVHGLEILAGSVGIIGALLVAASYALLTNFRNHPAEIVLIVSLCDLFLTTCSLDQLTKQRVQSTKFFVRGIAWLVHPKGYKDVRSFHIFSDDCASSIAWSAFFETASVMWNGARFPEKDASKFVKYYHGIVWSTVLLNIAVQLAAISVLLGLLNSPFLCHFKPDKPSHAYTASNSAVAIDYFIAMSAVAVAAASMVYTSIRFGLGISTETRNLAIRHYIFSIIFIFLWTAEKSFVISENQSIFHTAIGLLWQAQGFFYHKLLLKYWTGGFILIFELKKQTHSGYLVVITLRNFVSNVIRLLVILKNEDDDTHSRLIEERESIVDIQDPISFWGVSTSIRTDLSVADSLGVRQGRPSSSTSKYKPPSSKLMLYGDL